MSKDKINDKQIIVWRFEDAPEELQAMSKCGGDEDWIVEVPPKFKDSWIRWLYYIDAIDHPEEIEQDHPYRDGWKIYIGTH